LKQQWIRAGDAMVFRRSGAGLARRVARFALAIFVVLAQITIAASFRRAQALLVQAPAFDATSAA